MKDARRRSAASGAGATVAEPVAMKAADVVARARSLASFPATFHHVSEVIGKPGSSADLVAEAMKSDQSLCARLLKLANSAYYGYPQKVDSLRQAIVIIGTRQIQDMMAATMAVDQFKGISPDLVDMRSFWRHSLACGLGAKALAQMRHEPNTERFFISGLLHDVGSLVLYQEEPALASAALFKHMETDVPLQVAEYQVFGFDHADVTGALLEVWRLPPGIGESAAAHHRPSSARNPLVATTIQVADALAYSLGLGTAGEVHVPVLDPSTWAAVGLPEDVTPLVQREIKARLEEVESLFFGDD